jgi:hypothetical protein
LCFELVQENLGAFLLIKINKDNSMLNKNNISQIAFYRAMSAVQLYEYVLNHSELITNTAQSYCQKHAQLANACKEKTIDGVSVYRKVGDHFGWRRLRNELREWGINDWRKFMSENQFLNVSDWKRRDSRSYLVCSQNADIYPVIKKEFITKPIMVYNEQSFDSEAEIFVAKALELLKIKYKIHGKWGFSLTKNTTRTCLYDFKFTFNKKTYFIEVWMASKNNLRPYESNDTMIKAYLERRENKEKFIKAKIKDIDAVLISIEARNLKFGNLTSFVDHVKDQFIKAGINEAKDLEASNIKDVSFSDLSKWTVDDFFEDCIKRKIEHITKLPQLKQNLLTNSQKNLLRDMLCKHYGHACNTRFYLEEFHNVVAYIRDNTQIRSKGAYYNAHQQRLLPNGFPADPLQAYEECLSWSNVWGEDSLQLITDYNTAKDLVAPFGFRSSTEFECARDSNTPKYKILKSIYKLPDHPYSGYKGWVNWADFLSLEPRLHCTEEGQKIILNLQNGSVLSVCRILKELNIKSKTQIRKLSKYAIDAFDKTQTIKKLK